MSEEGQEVGLILHVFGYDSVSGADGEQLVMQTICDGVSISVSFHFFHLDSVVFT